MRSTILGMQPLPAGEDENKQISKTNKIVSTQTLISTITDIIIHTTLPPPQKLISHHQDYQISIY